MSKTFSWVVFACTTVMLATGAYLSVSALNVLQHPLKTEPDTGSVTGPDSTFDCETHNSIQRCFTKKPLALATSTPCSIKTPSATSTLVTSQLRVSGATSTATLWVAAKSATPFATTTALLPLFSLGSALQGTMVVLATSTNGTATVDPATVFAPNTYLVWGAAGFAPAGTFLSGQCEATFETI